MKEPRNPSSFWIFVSEAYGLHPASLHTFQSGSAVSEPLPKASTKISPPIPSPPTSQPIPPPPISQQVEDPALRRKPPGFTGLVSVQGAGNGQSSGSSSSSPASSSGIASDSDISEVAGYAETEGGHDLDMSDTVWGR